MSELIDRIRLKCIECGECLLWQGAMSGGQPMIKVDGKTGYARRIWWEHHHGPVKKGNVVARICENERCIVHAQPMTIAKVAQRVAATGVWSRPARRAKIAAKRQMQCGKVTPDQVREIRTGSNSARHYAREFGIDPSLAARIRRGEAYRDYSNPFAGLGR